MQVYVAIAQILEKQEYDPDFAALMIQTLNLILLTSSEFKEMRKNIRDLLNEDHKNLFVTLYRSWCNNPASIFSLCLLAHVYEHACTLIEHFAELEINVNFLVEIDKLIQLIESPIFIGILSSFSFPHSFFRVHFMFPSMELAASFSFLFLLSFYKMKEPPRLMWGFY